MLSSQQKEDIARNRHIVKEISIILFCISRDVYFIIELGTAVFRRFIDNMRAQGYDETANMSGIHRDLQARIRERIPTVQ
jgi:hypothetical protein